MKNDISIIIINYNTYRLTKEAIQSVIEKTKGCTYEIIVVDNHSDEDASPLREQFPFINYIQSDKNLGFAAGNNLGIQNAKGEYVLLLNSDTLLKNDAVSIILNYLKKNPKLAVASSRLEFPDGRLQHACQRFPSIKYLGIELFRLQKLWSKEKRGRVLLGAFFDHKTAIISDWVWGTFFMFKRDLLKQLPEGKLSKTFFMYGEDRQWCMEFRKLGYEVGYEPRAQVIHLMGASNGEKEKWIKENEEKFLQLYYPLAEQLLIKFMNRLLRVRLKSIKN